MSEVENKKLEEKAYSIVAKFNEYLPVENDRYRLGYCVYKYLIGEGDSPEIIVKTNKLTIDGISENELASKLATELS